MKKTSTTAVVAISKADALPVPAALGDYLRGALGKLDAELMGATADQAWQAAQRGLEMETAGKILAGRAFIHLRESLDKQQFAAGLAERGLPRRSAYYAIEVYNLFAAMPDGASVQALAQLGVTKAMAFASWAHDDVAALAHGEEVHGLTLESVTDATTRELEALAKQALRQGDEVEKLKTETATLKTQLETARMERDRALKQAKYLLAEEDMPHFALSARQEAMAHTEGMTLALDMLADVSAQAVFTQITHPEANRFQPIVAATIYYALGGVLARVVDQMHLLGERFDSADQVALSSMPFNPGELKLFHETRERIAGRAEADARKRETKRENNRPGKVGRKRNEG